MRGARNRVRSGVATITYAKPKWSVSLYCLHSIFQEINLDTASTSSSFSWVHSLFERESYQTSRAMTIFVTNTACFLAEKNTYFRKMIIGYRPITCLSLSINVSFCFVLGKHVIVALPGGPNCRGLLCTCIRWRPRHQGSRQNVASSTHGAKPLQQNNF